MPPKAIVKVKKPKAKDLKETTELFNQMMGIGKVNVCITAPKYRGIIEIITNIVELNDIFALICDKQSLPALEAFQQQCRDIVAGAMSLELQETLGQISEERHDEFSNKYYELKDHAVVKKLIITCSNLDAVKIDTAKNAKGTTLNFLADDTRATVEYLAYCPFDFKAWAINQLALTGGTHIEQRRLTVMVSLLAQWKEITKSLYDVINSADIEVEEFVNIIKESLASIRQHPELQGCSEAFKRIEESLSMLRGNFDKYYSDFVESGNNSTIIIENFILDVSKSTKSSPALVMQFKKIISYYKNIRERSKQAGGNTTIDRLFEKIDTNIQKLDELNAAKQ